MIVASFYAPRHDVWGCDYDALLDLLDASCKRLGLAHQCISDEPRPRVATALMPLPKELMQAILEGQWRFLCEAKGPVFFTGADCLVTRDPTPYFAGDLTITVGPFTDCRMNTGAVFVPDPAKCAPVWRKALDMRPTKWGEDQTSLYSAILESGLDVRELAAKEHNWAPGSPEDDAGMPTVVHFRGRRKAWMQPWSERFLSAPPKPARIAA